MSPLSGFTSEVNSAAFDTSQVLAQLNLLGQGVSVIIPIKNEADNIAPLWQEIFTTLHALTDWEVIFINDGSTDASLSVLQNLQKQHTNLRILHHASSCGQSTALYRGVQAARFKWVATLDGDGQNDPKDLPALLLAALTHQAQHSASKILQPILITGHRTQRRDQWITRWSSRIANGVRSRLLQDNTPDTGCGIKVFTAHSFLQLPYFDHMHRFLPALFKRLHGQVISVPVNHRARHSGRSNYGIHNRLWVGIVDLFGVIWLLNRNRLGPVSEIQAPMIAATLSQTITSLQSTASLQAAALSNTPTASGNFLVAGENSSIDSPRKSAQMQRQKEAHAL